MHVLDTVSAICCLTLIGIDWVETSFDVGKCYETCYLEAIQCAVCLTNCVLLARDQTRGQEAVATLEEEGLHPKFHKLDIDDQESIEQLRQFLVDTYGGLDILVNNAGIAYKVWYEFCCIIVLLISFLLITDI